MRSHLKILAICAVFVASSLCWLALSGITRSRESEQTEKLRGSVQSLWGSPEVQAAPVLTFRFQTEERVVTTEYRDGKEVKVENLVKQEHERAVQLASSDIDVVLDSDLRRKGLAWYSLYDVGFTAVYSYVHEGAETGQLEAALTFPDAGAIYDDFSFTLGGVDGSKNLDPQGGVVRAVRDVQPGERVELRVHYKSRGLDRWEYQPTRGVGSLEQFDLTMRTNFSDIDFPPGTLSPSHKTRANDGYALTWSFKQIVTGNGIGMLTPQRIQPGALASELALTAPISLFFFFFVIFVLATLRDIDLHPMNYALIAGAFFAFHLLFAYSVDHLPVEWAFALASLVSVFLVVSYLRLVVSARFAFVEAGIAQLVYLVGFSLAHFFDGFTGLTTTILAIVTLYALMQLTGRVRWSSVLSPRTAPLPARP